AVAGAVCSSTVIPQTGSIGILQDYRVEEGRFKGDPVSGRPFMADWSESVGHAEHQHLRRQSIQIGVRNRRSNLLSVKSSSRAGGRADPKWIRAAAGPPPLPG